MRKISLAALLASACMPAYAAELASGFASGDDLLKSCTKKNLSECTLYLRGVADGFDLAQAAVEGNGRAVCMPITQPFGNSHVRSSQLVEVAVHYLKKHPEYYGDRRQPCLVLRSRKFGRALRNNGQPANIHGHHPSSV